LRYVKGKRYNCFGCWAGMFKVKNIRTGWIPG